MGLRNKLRRKIRGIRLRKFFIGNGRKKSRKVDQNGKRRASWMMHISHGYHVVKSDAKPLTISDHQFDSVVVQREQIRGELDELWFFGVFDDGIIAEAVTKYMQSHFFDKMPKESRMGKKSKEAMQGAHLNARAMFRDRDPTEEIEARNSGSASAMVINGEKLVMANMGDFRAVICIDGEAYQISGKKQNSSTRHWSLKLKDALSVPKASVSKSSKSSEVVVGSERIDSETEFVILASSGVWEVMKHQEAVNLIRHIENPQMAAECLASEALIRMSRSNISCLIIRFDWTSELVIM